MGCIRDSGIFRVGVEGGRLIRIHMVFRVFSSEFVIARYNNILYRLYLRVLRLQVGPRLQCSGQKVKLESDHPNNTGKDAQTGTPRPHFYTKYPTFLASLRTTHTKELLTR